MDQLHSNLRRNGRELVTDLKKLSNKNAIPFMDLGKCELQTYFIIFLSTKLCWYIMCYIIHVS